MNALLPNSGSRATEECESFVVSHGKSGVLGAFTASAPFERGQAVLVQTARGLEIGTVLRLATIHQARLFGAASSGQLLRRVTEQDQTRRRELTALEQQIFDCARAFATRDALTLEILDVDLLFDGLQAIVQFVGNDTDTDHLAPALEQQFHLTIRLENLALPVEPEKHEHAGCDKPDCGRADGGGGGCSTCSTGGGCSSCGSAKVDLREYFGHLRQNMEKSQRIPLA